MQPTKKCYAGIHVIMFFDQQRDIKIPISREYIYTATNLNVILVEPVITKLIRAGILGAAKCPNGGIYMNRRASDITLLEVTEAIDGKIRGYCNYPDGIPLTQTRIGESYDAIAQAFRNRLSQVRLSKFRTKRRFYNYRRDGK